MMNENTQNKEETQNKGNMPTHLVYHVVDYGEGQKSKWDQIGAAWEHKDGEGMNIKLKLFPVNGELTIRRRKEKEENGAD
ncbi:MAG: hypothetical protein NPINA01_32270 [Nitrospinaceae bacterium]|nr:MAG: hypothetical protein NPINA01_32270 [Nitrospinaceae bacterium]